MATVIELLRTAEQQARKAHDTDTADHIRDVIADLEERVDRGLWETGQHSELRLREEARRNQIAAE